MGCGDLGKVLNLRHLPGQPEPRSPAPSCGDSRQSTGLAHSRWPRACVHLKQPQGKRILPRLLFSPKCSLNFVIMSFKTWKTLGEKEKLLQFVRCDES